MRTGATTEPIAPVRNDAEDTFATTAPIANATAAGSDSDSPCSTRNTTTRL
ncbi:hypothetical protein KGQ19_36705 [Catenulispora sp. NL8]|uniref:Uncharacterized protein n=1 Tax=Catenulispora pinistramenti TaxID=2705254 RepID=A0ABS5L267_9ACTN|nr:hypothetical protein [Catenulispora pinistramenti]MBS2552411.1 hypothetical protein [Catenulispora pinistramenti]